MFETEIKKPRVALVCVDTGEFDAESSMDELAELASTAGAEVAARLIQRRPTADNATCIGAGRLLELKELCQSEDIDQVIFDCELTASQVRNIERVIDTHTIDRTTLILDIFAQRAVTREGRLQVELAQYKYRLPRLAGMGVSLSRLGGGIGTRGPGETKLETDKRHIRNRIQALTEELKEIEQRRGLSRKRRKKDGVIVCAVVGYTNAGKSTLLNKLTDAGVLAEDKLFATLETTSRKLILPDEREVVIVDTVGLISRLPHNLVEAFKSTLEEAANADVIIHLCDASDPECRKKSEVTLELLKELGCEGIPTVTVFSKCDLAPEFFELTGKDAVAISSVTGEGLDEMLAAVAKALPDNTVSGRFLFPFDLGGVLAQVRELGRVSAEEYTAEGVAADITLDRKYLHIIEGCNGRIEKIV
ncbi:MAG: GTPase HflX [Oscillospiraceae bacterium]